MVYGFVHVHVTHLQCVTLCYSVSLCMCVCVCAGEDSEPGGECSDNSGTYQPGNKWTSYFVSWLLNFN